MNYPVLYKEQRDPAGVSPQFDLKDLVYAWIHGPVFIQLFTNL